MAQQGPLPDKQPVASEGDHLLLECFTRRLIGLARGQLDA
jgi:hypothetical protein